MMQRRYILAAGGVLVLLLAAAGLFAFILPGQSPGPTPPPPQPTATNTAAVASSTSTQQAALSAQPGDTTVTLTWQPVAGAAGYFIYRDGADTPLTVEPLTETRYEDIGLSNGRTYTYAVTAVDRNGKAGTRLPEIKVTPRSK